MSIKKINSPVSNHVAKVPLVMQMEALECGAASLAMVLAYYDLWIPLEQLRKECGVSRDGSKLKNIVDVAKKYNLETHSLKCPLKNLKEIGKFPAIAFWEYNHFIVVDGFKKNKVYVNDPARGKVTLSIEEFEKSYSGICTFFEPSENFQTGGKPASILAFALQRLKGTMPMFLMLLCTTLIASIVALLMPVFSRFFVDALLTQKNNQWSTGFFTLVGLTVLFQISSMVIKSVYLLRLQGKMAVVANTSFLWHILRLPVEFFEQRMAGDIAQRQQSNQAIANTLINTLAPVILDSAALIFNLIIMINYSPFLASLGILSVLGNLWLAQIISDKRIDITRVQMRDAANLQGTTLRGIDMIETIKSAGAENGFFSRWAGFQSNAISQTAKYAKLDQTLGQLPPLVQLITTNLILFLSIRLFMQGEWTIGLISAFNGYILAFSTPAQSLILALQQIQEMRTNMERVQDVMKYPVDVTYEAKTDEELQKLSGLVEVNNITFGYNKLEKPIIENFSMKLEPGKSVAIVGASGCGKSTIAKLIAGLYPVWSGEILFDGKTFSQINRNVFTGSVACVNQDITLFEDTIANNIRMWDKSIENFEIILAARDAAIHDEIVQRDGDYSAPVQEGGKNFSGGQRQRIEIAGALAQDPTIMIMDEATSALDSKTEYDVVKSIAKRGIACIIISHRLSIIRDCDEIIVLVDGKILDRGTHSELMKRCEYYAELITNE